MKKNRLSKNIIYNFIYQLLTIILPLITTPYLSRVLGPENIGIYGYTFSIVTYFALFGSLGIAIYGQREIAKEQENKEKYSNQFWEILAVRIISSLISIILMYILFCVNNIYSNYYKIYLLYMIAYMIDITWFFQGLEEFKKTVVRNSVVKLFGLILIFIFIKNPSDLNKYILIFSLTELLGNLSLWVYLPKYVSKINFKKLNLKKHIIPISLLFIPQIATQVYTVLDKTMVGLITNNMSEVGFYEQAQKIARAAVVVIMSVQTVMNSRVANAYAKKQTKKVTEYLDKTFEFVWFIGIPLVLGLIAVSSNLVPWYYGNDFLPVRDVLISISPIILLIGLNGTTGNVYLIQTGKQKIYTISVVIGALVNCFFNILFIPFFNSTGAAISSVLAELLILLIHIIYMKKIYDFKKIIKYSIKPLIAGIIMFIFTYYLSMILAPSIINTCLIVIIGGLVYGVCLLLLKYQLVLNIINMLKLKRNNKQSMLKY